MYRNSINSGDRASAASLIAVLALVSHPRASADDDDMAEFASLFPTGRHLTELTYTYFDTEDGELDLWLPRYTYAYSTSLRMAASIGVMTTDPEDGFLDGETGKTDSVFLLQYDPSANLTANAFVPDTVGITFALEAPTGDHDKGIGQDLWAATLGAGWLVDFPWNFWLLPSIQYRSTFAEADGYERQERADLGLGLYWLFSFKGWLGIEPVFAYDNVQGEEALDWSVVMGKAWSSGWAVDVRWSQLESVGRPGARDDETVFFGVSYQFGAPPRGFVP